MFELPFSFIESVDPYVTCMKHTMMQEQQGWSIINVSSSTWVVSGGSRWHYIWVHMGRRANVPTGAIPASIYFSGAFFI